MAGSGSLAALEQPQLAQVSAQPLDSWDPLWANAEVYADLPRKSWRTRRWIDKLRVWLKPLGWQPPDLPAAAAFDLARVRRYDPPLTRSTQVFALPQLAALLAGALLFLWHAETLAAGAAVRGLAMLTAGLWLLGAVLQGRLRVRTALGLQIAALAAAVVAGGDPWGEPRDNTNVSADLAEESGEQRPASYARVSDTCCWFAAHSASRSKKAVDSAALLWAKPRLRGLTSGMFRTAHERGRYA